MSTILPHLALHLALSSGGVHIPVDNSIVASAAVTVRYSDFHPTATNSAVSTIEKHGTVLPLSPEPDWVIDWLIRAAAEAPQEEIAKLPSDLSATVDRDLYRT